MYLIHSRMNFPRNYRIFLANISIWVLNIKDCAVFYSTHLVSCKIHNRTCYVVWQKKYSKFLLFQFLNGGILKKKKKSFMKNYLDIVHGKITPPTARVLELEDLQGPFKFKFKPFYESMHLEDFHDLSSKIIFDQIFHKDRKITLVN